MTRLENILGQDWLYPHPERLVPFLGNHDTKRFMSEDGATLADLKLGFGPLATMRGMPQVYSGDEIAMRGGDDPDNRRDFPGGFAGDPRSAFSAAGRTPEQQESFTWAGKLFRFRGQHIELQTGEQQDVLVDDTAFVFVRAQDVSQGCGVSPAGANRRFLIAVNNSLQARTVTLDTQDTALSGCMEFADAFDPGKTLSLAGSHLQIPLGAKDLRIFEVR